MIAVFLQVNFGLLPLNKIKDALFKIRKAGDNREFDEIPYEFFNTTGAADEAVNFSESKFRSFNSIFFGKTATDQSLG